MDDLDRTIEAAIRRGEDLAGHEPRAISARFDIERKRLVIELSTGAELSISPSLLNLPEGADLSGVQILGDGYDLYFPKIDEGVFVPDLCRSAFDMQLAA
ncbi:hypothetical protein EDC61_109132 [Sulfuritortus calidifontis]|uniref:DUF2442 domain-containing protein n=1 Tax=Sulfuritortus calidifontis TaxID=1914471 RepID=A0A4R3JXC4_9PROT|nr:hypothetical protein [Sulfuritortus calidifontis]TCS71586.1 hypothetical protein EDC61_109132 [Sulfuritortus calidifontis]